ncbi:MAG: hypothetical protein QOH25_2471 [Acidobacteriota bacterium]|jgi:hypothetical protein|nr:hypothetical protein [Acidobacteriota bacterium]
MLVLVQTLSGENICLNCSIFSITQVSGERNKFPNVSTVGRF